ncbi:hypothetical protein GCM10023185_41990 [Hymenobacter saemangeumensis]|uniref:histidine kinase n=1 Tax=Hymenobacter saemangeumensis TaxID=1084522 RepID=A0ABP8IRJ4_9BACT
MDFAHVFEALSAQGPLVYFCYRPADGRVIYISPNYEHELGGHLGAVNEELADWLHDLHPDDRRFLAETMAHAATGGLVRGAPLRFLRPDGSLRWLCLTATRSTPPDDPTGPLVSGYLQDITRTQANRELSERYQAKKNSMLEILSHDLASPLILAEQLSEYIAERVETLRDEHLDRMIADMRTACRDGVTLIRDFVDQEFLESASLELQLVRLDLAERLRIVVDNYQHRQHVAGHRFHYETSHPSIYAKVDESKFLQVVNNLLGNALKFTPDGGLVTVTLHQHPAHLLLTVADTGIGIPAALQSCLFERFTRARRPGLRGEKTTGLGMSIIKTLVELHHGRIWFESAEGQGTTFYIQLPLAEPA